MTTIIPSYPGIGYSVEQIDWVETNNVKHQHIDKFLKNVIARAVELQIIVNNQENEITALFQQSADLDAQIVTLNNQISSQQSQINGMTSYVQSLQSQVSENNENVKDIQTLTFLANDVNHKAKFYKTSTDPNLIHGYFGSGSGDLGLFANKILYSNWKYQVVDPTGNQGWVDVVDQSDNGQYWNTPYQINQKLIQQTNQYIAMQSSKEYWYGLYQQLKSTVQSQIAAYLNDTQLSQPDWYSSEWPDPIRVDQINYLGEQAIEMYNNYKQKLSELTQLQTQSNDIQQTLQTKEIEYINLQEIKNQQDVEYTKLQTHYLELYAQYYTLAQQNYRELIDEHEYTIALMEDTHPFDNDTDEQIAERHGNRRILMDEHKQSQESFFSEFQQNQHIEEEVKEEQDYDTNLQQAQQNSYQIFSHDEEEPEHLHKHIARKNKISKYDKARKQVKAKRKKADDEFKTEMAQLRATISKRDEELVSAKQDVNDLISDKQQLTYDIGQLQAQMEQLNESNNKLLQDYDLLEQDLVTSQLSNGDKAAEIQTMTNQIADLNSQITQKDQTIQTMTNEMADLNSQITQKDQTIQTMTNEMADLNSQITQKDAKINELEQDLLSSQVLTNEKAAEIDGLEEDLADLNSKITQKDAEIQDLEQEFVNAQISNNEKDAEIQDLEQQLVNAQISNNDKDAEIQDLEQELVNASILNNEKDAEIDRLKQEKNAFEQQAVNLQVQLDARDQQIQTLNAQLQQQGNQSDQTSDSYKLLQSQYDTLNESNKKLQQDYDKLNESNKKLLQDYDLLEQDLVTSQLSNDDKAAEIQTMTNQIADLNSQITQKDAKINELELDLLSSQVLTNEKAAEIDGLEEDLANAQVSNNDNNKKIVELKAEIVELKAEIQSLKDANHSNDEIADLEAEIERLKDKNTELFESNQQINVSWENCQMFLEDRNKEIQELTAQNLSLQSQVNSLRPRVEELQKQLEELRSDRTHDQLRLEIEQLQQQKEDQFKFYTAELKMVQETNDQLNQQIKELEEKNLQLQQQNLKLRASNGDLELQARIERLLQDNLALQNRIDYLEQWVDPKDPEGLNILLRLENDQLRQEIIELKKLQNYQQLYDNLLQDYNRIDAVNQGLDQQLQQFVKDNAFMFGEIQRHLITIQELREQVEKQSSIVSKAKNFERMKVIQGDPHSHYQYQTLKKNKLFDGSSQPVNRFNDIKQSQYTRFPYNPF